MTAHCQCCCPACHNTRPGFKYVYLSILYWKYYNGYLKNQIVDQIVFKRIFKYFFQILFSNSWVKHIGMYLSQCILIFQIHSKCISKYMNMFNFLSFQIKYTWILTFNVCESNRDIWNSIWTQVCFQLWRNPICRKCYVAWSIPPVFLKLWSKVFPPIDICIVLQSVSDREAKVNGA